MNKDQIYTLLSLNCLKMIQEIPRNNFWKIYGDIYHNCRSNTVIKLETYPKSVTEFYFHLLPYINKIDPEEYNMIGVNCEKSLYH